MDLLSWAAAPGPTANTIGVPGWPAGRKRPAAALELFIDLRILQARDGGETLKPRC
jgi:hypothetical protein